MLTRIIVILTVLIILPIVSYSMPHDKLAVYYVYGSDVNIRRAPDLDSRVEATLPIGSEICVLEKTKDVTTVDFYTDYWYKIIYYKKSIELYGYIWGGFIANQYFKVDLDNDGSEELLLVRNFTEGLYSQVKEELKNIGSSDNPYLQLKIIKKGVLVNTLNISCPGESRSMSAEVIRTSGFDGQMNILHLQYGCCGESSGYYDNYYLVSGDNLKLFLSLYNNSEGGDSVGYKVFFPEDKGGKPKRIVVKSIESSYGQKDVKSFEEYVWDKSKNIFIKK
ncbi:MAG TPA: SH3 domain-containing protein [Spirochaetota bacterium]|nr:SH3 domain-containing protein [Spirochaetota bacterium]HOR44613.1 SH3 domain-containing protein [Spirochaetota bacterium]HPK56029.1 SH3 domain-containing protein [Spirochaetota bacterium]